MAQVKLQEDMEELFEALDRAKGSATGTISKARTCRRPAGRPASQSSRPAGRSCASGLDSEGCRRRRRLLDWTERIARPPVALGSASLERSC